MTARRITLNGGEVFDLSTGSASPITDDACRLAAGVVGSVVRDLRSSRLEIRRDANDWIAEDVEEGPCGLVWCAEALGMEPRALVGRVEALAVADELAQTRARVAARRERLAKIEDGDRQVDRVLAAVEQGASTSREVAELAGLPLATASACLSVIARSGWIEKVGMTERDGRSRPMNIYVPVPDAEEVAA